MTEDEYAGALAWVADVLGAPARVNRRLEGGMTSTMLEIVTEPGDLAVLRLMTEEPWRTHGAELAGRESEAQHALADTVVPAPSSLALDVSRPVAAHLMTRLPGDRRADLDQAAIEAMVEMLMTIHEVVPADPFRDFQSWAWEAKWVVPTWSTHPGSWRRAFDLLAAGRPDFEPTFLHRDFSHRNLLWSGDRISGVVDWVETSTGPAWLDAGHAATNLAVAYGPELARAFVRAYADRSGTEPETFWLVMDAVGFLPPPGKRPMFDSPGKLARLDAWLHELVLPHSSDSAP